MEVIIGTTNSEISDQLRDAYSIGGRCLNVATYKWKVNNGRIEIISFDIKFRSLLALTIILSWLSRYEINLAVSLSSSSVEYMRLTKSPTFNYLVK